MAQMNGEASMLAEMYAAVRLQFTWWGTKRALNDEQTKAAAQPFGAEAQFMSAQKRLADTKHEAFRKVSACRNAAKTYWRGHTLPYPEPAIRLIKRSDILKFDSEMARQQSNLAEAVVGLQAVYDDLIIEARLSLGALFNPKDYPESILDQFSLTWDYVEVRPPNYLKEASPELYEQALQRVEAKFNQAIEMAEQAFIDEFGEMVHHLAERMEGTNKDGKQKVFRDSIITNLTDFFGRFREMNVSGSHAIDNLVAEAEALVSGVQPEKLRSNAELRAQMKLNMDAIFEQVSSLMSDRPRRKLLQEE